MSARSGKRSIHRVGDEAKSHDTVCFIRKKKTKKKKTKKL